MQSQRSSDPADPRTWWVQLVDAVAGLQRGDKAPAIDYLRFVVQHRGRPVADACRESLLRYRDNDAFRDCHLWPANGYRPTPKRKTRS